MSQNTPRCSTFKLLEQEVYTNEDVIKRLEALLEKAKSGKLTDFLMVYLEENEHSFSHSYRGHKKSQLIGLTYVLLAQLAIQTYELEPQD